MKRFLAALTAACLWAQTVFAITVTPIGHANFAVLSNTLVITTTANIAAGDLVQVCIVQGVSSVSLPTVADAAGNSYANSAGGTFGATSIGVRRAQVNANAMAAGNSITISWVTAPTTAAATAVTISGMAATTFDVSGTAQGSSTTPTFSVTNTNAPDESVGCVAVQGPITDTFTEDASFTTVTGDGTNTGIAANDSTIHMAYAPRLTTGAHSYSPTLGTLRAWRIFLTDWKTSVGGCGALGLLGAGC